MSVSPLLDFETNYEITLHIALSIEDSALDVEGVEREKLEVALRNATEETLRLQAVTAAAITVVISTDEDVQRLNSDYRGIDAVTDVLSFSNHEQREADVTAETEATQAAPQLILPPELLDEQALYLGDIVIASSYAARQAKRFGRSVIEEFQLLAIHGTLHLLGFDHDTEGKQERMWSHQNTALLALGLATTDAERSI